MNKIIVDSKEYFTEKKTIMEALDEVGIEVPRLCKHPDLEAIGSCRLCLVEVNGRILTSCNTLVQDGMNIETYTERVIKKRQENLKLIIESHNVECLTCFRNNTCELQDLSSKYSVDNLKKGKQRPKELDNSSYSIVRDSSKCILCGRCVEVCKNQGIEAIDFSSRGFKTKIIAGFSDKIADTNCISCGQCVLYCPTGALTEKDDRKEVLSFIANKKIITFAQIAPAIRVSLSDEYNIPERIITKKLVSALKMIGFDYVIDTSFGADLTIMEEANELIERLGKKELMFTSCCPAWINFVETQRKDYIKNLSSCKSPHQMVGAVVKGYLAKKIGLDPKEIKVVSIMPCVAKKDEIQRTIQKNDGIVNVDNVITTRELIHLLNEEGINLKEMPETEVDFFGYSSAGEIFAKSGGVMEAAIRTANFLVDKDLEEPSINEVKHIKDYKRFDLNIAGTIIKVGIVNGMGNFIKHEKEIMELDFVEVMACPGGCIGGGGQPQPHSLQDVKKRKLDIIKKDKESDLRMSHQNPDIIKLYHDFLKHPGSKEAEEYLHTRYFYRKLN
ncbi:MAG: [FeFe] hydrogenase, group A [Candidatus Nanoarchaeia archaeon]|nr:[FeFe] hydrogenase, group A [Candidatus Nanoarchaeia archaeon]